MEGEEVLFKEFANVDEEEMCFGHPNDDGYYLYRFPIPESFDFEEVCKNIFHEYRDKYKYRKYNIDELYELRQTELKYQNEGLKYKFEKGQLNLKELVYLLTYDDIIRVPEEFNIWVTKGKFISNMEDDVKAVFLGERYIYYYEYTGCPWPH